MILTYKGRYSILTIYNISFGGIVSMILSCKAYLWVDPLRA